ncbi:phage tail tape measure protein [Metapseudomonas otitidis]|uniref:hypothetical protein n=1 Tax=Metapseudomonas otitidis TaxID=319939 RepID=UPI00209A9961|nr:hypothetical protein [Pseudomonas otitidis]MCO7558026.1 hypothetical protein [Pseudomonas otitidis]
MSGNRIATQLVIEGVNRAQPAFDQAEGQLSTLMESARSAGLALAGALSVAAVTAFVKTSIDAVDMTGELAERANMAAGEFAGLQYAAKYASIEGEALSAMLTKFNANIQAAADGSKKQAQAFDQLGVSLRNQDGTLKGTTPLLLEVADKLAKMPTGVEKSALSLDLFGKSGAKLLPLLNRGAEGIQALIDEAKELGLVLDDQAYADAGQFNDNMDVLSSAAEGAGQSLSIKLLPALNDVSGYLLTFTKDGKKAAESAEVLGTGIKLLTSLWIILAAGFKHTGGVIGAAFSAVALAIQGDFQGAATVIKEGVRDVGTNVGETADELTKLWSGEYGEQAMADRASAAADQFDAAVSGMGSSAGEAQQFADDLTAIQKQLLQESQEYLAEQVKAQSKANSELDKAQKAQVDTAKRYKDALAKLNAGGTGEPSFGQATALKVSAQKALASKDVDGAKTKAQAALGVLQKIQESGGNTYGFAGIIKQLQGIEEQADKIKLDKAKKSAEEAKATITELKTMIAEVTNVKVTLNLPDDEVKAIMDKFQKLRESIGQALTISPTVTPPTTDGGAAPTAKKFAGGGHVVGPGSGTSDSILARLSNGEFVMRAEAVRRYGVGLLSRMNGLAVPRFATGGPVGQVLAAASAPAPSLGTVYLNSAEGRTYKLLAEQPTFEELLHLQALKTGKPVIT